MHRTTRGLALGLVMVLGALMLTGLLAIGLQYRAEGLSEPETYAPSEGTTVDSNGWRIEVPKDAPPANAGTVRSRGRLLPGLAESGA